MNSPGGASDPTDALAISLMGDFRLQHAGQVVAVPPSSQRVIAFLAVAGRPLRRSYVATTLWVGVTEPRSQADLRSALWRTPKVAGRRIVESGDGLLWLPEEVEVDVASLMGRRDHPPLAPSEVHARVEALEQELLASWDDDWVLIERERVRFRQVQRLEDLAGQLIHAGRAREAVLVSRSLMEHEPLRESAQRLLVRAHAADGNVVEAIRSHQRFSAELERELGLKPSFRMDSLMAEILGAARRGP